MEWRGSRIRAAGAEAAGAYTVTLSGVQTAAAFGFSNSSATIDLGGSSQTLANLFFMDQDFAVARQYNSCGASSKYLNKAGHNQPSISNRGQ
jgi:hypothetical protein